MAQTLRSKAVILATRSRRRARLMNPGDPPSLTRTT